MKRLLSLIILFSLVYADLTDLPDSTTDSTTIINKDIETNTTINNDYDTEINSSTIDSITGEVIYSETNDTEINNPMDYGNKKVSEIFNNMQNINTNAKASSIVNNMPGNKDFMSDPSKATYDYIRTHYEANSSIIQALNIVQNVQDNAIANFLKKQETVKCYITRKLVNAYYCPLPNRDESYYVGGSINDDKDSAQKRCNEDCKNPLTVLSMDTTYELEKEFTINKNVYKDVVVKLDTNPNQLIENLNLTFLVNDKAIEINATQDNQNSIFNFPIKNYDFKTTFFVDKDKFNIVFNKNDENNSYFYFEFNNNNVSLFNSLNETPIVSTQIPTITNKTITFELQNNNGKIILYIDNIPYINQNIPIQSFYSNIEIPFKTTNSSYTPIINNRYIKYDIYDENNSFITSQELKLNSRILQITQYIQASHPYKELVLKFYQPYQKDNYNQTITTLNNDLVILNQVQIKYKSHKYYYCSNQFVENSDECEGGEIVSITIDGNGYNVCSTLYPGQAPNYAYYTESQAKAICYERAECVPTYKHLTLNDGVPDWAYDVEVGCVESDDNKLCTDEICKELYLSTDHKIIEEKTWYGDDKVVETIKDGDIDTDRPRVDIETEISNDENKTQMFIEEMKDVAYKHMINDGTYNISKDTIAKDYPREDSIKITDLGMDKSIEWLIKGNSYAYDGDDYYFYVVVDVAEQYYNKTFQLLDENTNTYKNAIDIGVLDRDDIFLLIDNTNNYHIFRKKEFYKRKIPIRDENGTITNLVWQDTNSLKVDNKTFKDDEWMAYSTSDKAPYFRKQKFSSDNLYERFKIFDAVYSTLENIPGVEIHSQQKDGSNLIKIYTGDEDDTYKSRLLKYKLYGIYSKTQLTYDELIQKITDDNLIFDSEHPNNYINPIKGEGYLDKNNVEIFIYGKPDNFSVNGVFKPSPQEEAKKAFIFMFLNDK